MIIVSNTSPLSNLAVIGHLKILQQLYSKIIIPPAVYKELTRLNKIGVQIAPLLAKQWLEIQSVVDKNLVEFLQVELDEGEAEAIALAIQLKSNRLLIDERLGRTVALQYGLEIRGLLGILTAAKVDGLIPAVKPLLDDLRTQAGFRVSPNLYERTLREVKE